MGVLGWESNRDGASSLKSNLKTYICPRYLLFLQSFELGPPTPFPAGECVLRLWFRRTLACGRRDGGSHFGEGTDTVAVVL
jgi:hypothetical protein